MMHHHQRTDDGTPGCSEDTSSQCMSTDDDSDDDFFQYNDWHNGMNTVYVIVYDRVFLVYSGRTSYLCKVCVKSPVVTGIMS